MSDDVTAARLPATAKPATPEILFERLSALGIAVETHSHPPVFTVEEAQAHCSHLPGGHCKNLLLRDKKKRTYLLVALNERPIDLKTLPDKIGSGRLSFASADRLMQYLGVKPGSVTPFALINDPDQVVQVFLDRAMLEEHALLNFHPLQNSMTTAITPGDLLAFIAACGHNATLVDL
jgi:Ala-tRNA(Pro) deacylase